MTPEGALSAPTDVSSAPVAGASNAEGSSPSTPVTGAPTEQPTGDVTAPVQGQPTPQQEADPLEGVPSLDELKTLTEQNAPNAKALAQLRSAYESLKPQLNEITERFKPFEPVADRFTSPEEVQELVDFKEKLFGWQRDESNQLIPATESAAQYLAEKFPQHADFLAADLLNGTTRHPETGQLVPRIDIALEAMAGDPARRATALKILGGVEPNSIAPTWQPTAEELQVVKPELQDIYKKLPYDKRESLKLNDPEFINEYLNEQKFKQDLIEQNRQAQERETRQQQAHEEYLKQQAAEAGNKQVEQGFRQVFTEFKQSVVEKAKFVAPLDPQSDAAQAMAPEQVQEFNQTAEKINIGMGSMIALVTAAMAVPDTKWLALDFFKSVGLDDKTIQDFDNARQEFATNSRDYGELSFTNQPQNGNGSSHPGLGQIQSNTTRASKSMKGYGNLVAKPLFDLVSQLFEMKAGNYNSTLNGAPPVRPSIAGSAHDPTRDAPARPQGWQSRTEIERLYG